MIKIILPRIFGIIAGLIIILVALRQSEALSNQVISIMERVFDLFNKNGQDISTARHASYPIVAFRTWATYKNIIYWLFGIGPRTSGLALINNSTIDAGLFTFSAGMYNNIWAVESDIAELILGYGLIGFVLYYFMLIRFVKNRNTRLFGLAMFVMSFMYDYSSLSFNVIVITFVFLLIRSNSLDDKNRYNTGKLQTTRIDNGVYRVN